MVHMVDLYIDLAELIINMKKQYTIYGTIQKVYFKAMEYRLQLLVFLQRDLNKDQKVSSALGCQSYWLHNDIP